MTSRECYENKWFYMKYIGKYLSEEILLTRNIAGPKFMEAHEVGQTFGEDW
jgi:hypothetical protein